MKLDFGVFWAQKVTPHLRDFWNLSFTSALSKSVVHGALSFGRPGHTCSASRVVLPMVRSPVFSQENGGERVVHAWRTL